MNKQKRAKSPKTSKSETLVNFILDKSGSMESVRSATISGFNEYLNSLKKDGNKYSFSLILFDTNILTPAINKPIREVGELNTENYKPDGNTALYDAVCQVIKKIDEKDNQKIITVIMTDGEENSSKEYTQVQMKTLIQEREKKGNWSFVYLGANQNSYVEAQKYGISAMNTANFQATSRGVGAVMDTLSVNTSNFAMSATASTNNFFSKSDQDTLEAGDKISEHFSNLGKKSWESRKKDILGSK